MLYIVLSHHKRPSLIPGWCLHIMQSWDYSNLNSCALVEEKEALKNGLTDSFLHHYPEYHLYHRQQHREWGKFIFLVLLIFPLNSWLCMHPGVLFSMVLGAPITIGSRKTQNKLYSHSFFFSLMHRHITCSTKFQFSPVGLRWMKWHDLWYLRH